MSQSVGPFIDRYGLVFGYDATDTLNSYKGEPTINIAYASHPNLTSNSNWWFNSGTSILLNNDTSIPKPVIPNVDTTNLHIFSSEVTTVGNQHIGSAITPVSPSTQYTMSIYYWFNGNSMQAAPYLRTSVNNNSLGAFAYNGDTNYLNWPREKWIRLSVTFTTQSNENGVYMSSYTGDFVGEKVAYFAYQIEQKDHMTPLVLGTRGMTSSLVDYTGNSTIDMTNGGFDSTGQMYFDGTNDYGTVSGGQLPSLSNNATLIGWFYHNGTTAAPHRTIICTDYTYRRGLKLMSYYHGNMAAWVGNSDGAADYLLGGGATPTNSWNMLSCTRDTNGRLILYLNGVEINRADTGFGGTTSISNGPMIGGEYHSKYLGKLPLSLAYNRVLSADEILAIYNQTKSKSF